MARAILVIPPFIKYNSGPLLGPSLLQSTARIAGHHCSILDLNALYIQPKVVPRLRHGMFLGDHDKPGRQSGNPLTSPLADLENEFLTNCILPSLTWSKDANAMRRIKFGFLTHDDLYAAGMHLLESPFGKWVERELCSKAGELPPQLTGISILHAGQVVPAVVTSMIARKLWPDTLIAWGGPHVSGLGQAIKDDINARAYAADLFVTGHAEKSFVEILDQLGSESRHASNPRPNVPRFLESSRGIERIPPIFENMELYYDNPITLPAQSTLGCAYGKCAFCTYPSIEPVPARLDLLISVGSVVDVAESIGASVSIKDSLATPLRLKEIARCVKGRAMWSACTKLSPKFNAQTLQNLSDGGLATLEVGLETLLEESQQRLGKVQPMSLYTDFLKNVSATSSLSLVVNYMTGFPWEDKVEAAAGLQKATALLDQRLGERGLIEHNEFELERLSPMAKKPLQYGLDPLKFKRWPWASIIDWRM